MRIAVAGGTGTVGRHIVEVARERGHDAVALSRRTGTNLLTADDAADAMAGCEVVVDALGSPERDGRAAERFFTTTARTLQQAAQQVQARRVVVVSIVGIDQASSYGYYWAKLAQESEHRRGPVPAAIVRSTQFHDLPRQVIMATRRGNYAFLPRMRTQPIAARTAAEEILAVVEADAPGDLIEVGGPQPEDFVDMAKRLVAHRGSKLKIVALPIPGAGGRAMRDGSLLPGPGAILGGPTYGEWLAEQPRR